MMRRAMLVAVATSLVFLQINAVPAATLSGKAEIVDGDTIKVAVFLFASMGSTPLRGDRPASEMQKPTLAAKKQPRRSQS